MNRVVYIGGFGNGSSSTERVASALEPYYEKIDEFTFSEAMSNPDRVRRAVRGVDALTLSGGMLSLVGTTPGRIEAFGAPLPTTKLKLIGKTGLKTARMHIPGIGIRSPRDALAVGNYDVSSIAELVAHPVLNIRHLGDISRFNAIDAATAARQNDIPVSLHYTTGDEYYRLSEEQAAAAKAMDVNITLVPGIHDELIIRPTAMLQQVGFEDRL